MSAKAWCMMRFPCHPQNAPDGRLYTQEAVQKIVDQMNDRDGFVFGRDLGTLSVDYVRGSATLDLNHLPEGYYDIRFQAWVPDWIVSDDKTHILIG